MKRPLRSIALLALVLAGCGSADGGGRGTGLSAVVEGNIADSGAISALEQGCPFVAGQGTVRVLGTNLEAPVEPDCSFVVRDVPAGDVTLEITTATRANRITVIDVPGAAVVTLTDIRLGAENADVAAIEVRADEPAPARRFAIIADPPSGDAPLAVQFSFAPEAEEGTVVRWSFGDGGTSSEPAPAHSYAAVGDYVAALAVTEPGHETRRVYLVVRATEPPPAEPLSVRLAARPQNGAPPLTVHFQASVFGRRPPASLVWSFGDRSPSLVTSATEVTHEYERGGSFTAIVTVIDDLGRQAGASFPIVVERSAVSVRPTPAATATPSRR